MTFAKSSLKMALAVLFLTAAPGVLLGQGTPMANRPPRQEELRTLIATLQSADSTQHDKVVACHRLAIIGTKEAVPALAALLTDAKLSHIARHALEPMPDPAAAAALRDAGKFRERSSESSIPSASGATPPPRLRWPDCGRGR